MKGRPAPIGWAARKGLEIELARRPPADWPRLIVDPAARHNHSLACRPALGQTPGRRRRRRNMSAGNVSVVVVGRPAGRPRFRRSARPGPPLSLVNSRWWLRDQRERGARCCGAAAARTSSVTCDCRRTLSAASAKKQPSGGTNMEAQRVRGQKLEPQLPGAALDANRSSLLPHIRAPPICCCRRPADRTFVLGGRRAGVRTKELRPTGHSSSSRVAAAAGRKQTAGSQNMRRRGD